jgi:hypothetical protein
MNINFVSLEIEKIKFPIIFLFKLITYKNHISDQDMSIILRAFLKHHHIIAMETNLKRLFNNELGSISCNVINNFYKMIRKKMSLLFSIKKFHNIYDNKKFWKLSHEKQPDFLINIKEIFNAYYDCAKGGVPLHHKINGLLKNGEIKETIIIRLGLILKLLGPKIFTSLEIPLITVDDFMILSNNDIIKYLLFIHEKCNILLDQIIKLLNSYIVVSNNINSLINPIFITIKTIELDSDTKIEDILESK